MFGRGVVVRVLTHALKDIFADGLRCFRVAQHRRDEFGEIGWYGGLYVL